MRVLEALDQFYLSMEGVVSPLTLKWYRQKLSSLGDLIGNYEIEEVKVVHLRAWRADLSQKTQRWTDHPNKPNMDGGLSFTTLHGHVRACRRFFKWLFEERLLEKSPAERLERPPLPKNKARGLKQKERDILIETALLNNERDYAMALFLADTGCRVSGIVNLCLEDLDLANCTGIVREKGAGGCNKHRMVFFGVRTAEALRRWIRIRPKFKKCDYVFVPFYPLKGEYLNQAMTPGGVYQVFKRLAKKAGVKQGWNPHNWRHGAARGMIKNGASLIEVAQLLGHSSVQVTGDYYGIFSEDDLKYSHERYSWLNPRE